MSKEEYDKIVVSSKRSVLFTEGMSPSKVLLITEAPQMDIIEYDEVYDLNDYYDLDNSFSIAPHRKMRCGAFCFLPLNIFI